MSSYRRGSRRGAVFGRSEISLDARQREYNRRWYLANKEAAKQRSVDRWRLCRSRGVVYRPLVAPRGIRGWLKRLSRFSRGDVARAVLLESRREALARHDAWLESLDELEESLW